MTASSLTALSLTGRAAHGLATGDRTALSILDEVHARGGVDVIVLGADTAGAARDRTARRMQALDPVTIAVAWHARFPRWGFLAVAAPTRDHPYNLARRILGAHHLTGGRVGLALADDDPGLPLDSGSTPWLPGTPPGPAVTADAAHAIRELWNSWPDGTIVGDRERGVYARVDDVRRIDHDGLYRIAGPLGTPASALGEPVLAHWGTAAPDWAELTLGEGTLLIAGSPAGTVVAVSDAGGLPAFEGRSSDRSTPGLRGILGVAPRTLALEGRVRPYAAHADVQEARS